MFFPSPVHARCARSAVAMAALLSCLHAAQADDVLRPVVVTAARTPQVQGQALADTTVISREDIAREGATDLMQLLSRQPGVEMGRNGGLGTATDLFVRGANSRFTALYIDGVRVDSQNLQGGAPWNAIPLGLIDRIEIVRGSGSDLYGSDAVAGGLLALPLADTLKAAVLGPEGEARAQATVDRQGKWVAQTPQMFRVGLLQPALAAALSDPASATAVTDEASAIEMLGHAPRLVPGDWENIKVTWAGDFALAERLLRTRTWMPA